MQHVFVLSSDKKPLDPCHPARARKLLAKGKAAVYKFYPFTIILKDRTSDESVTHEYRVKIDPGSKITGIAIAQEATGKVVWGAELKHKGQQIVDALLSRHANRRWRRARHTRYRPARFNNRANGRRKGWLPPSILSRINNMATWVNRIARLTPVTYISMELVKFDTQLMENPDIQGVEYQRGTLYGAEVKEYLLEKWEHKCAYCGAKDKPLQIEHINPKTRGGSFRISNLAMACGECNEAKGTMTAAEFGHPEVQAQSKLPLKDAAVMNSMRWSLYRKLQDTGMSVECGTGGRTKFNRVSLGLPKTHWIDAACVGVSGEKAIVTLDIVPLMISASGRGRRQMCTMNKYGFPRTLAKIQCAIKGFRTGDIVKAIIPSGKIRGIHIGRVIIRKSGCFHVGKLDGIRYKYCEMLQHSDGYGYSIGC